MSRYTIMVIPEGAKEIKKFTISKFRIYFSISTLSIFTLVFGFMIFEYKELLQIKSEYKVAKSENQQLKGEAKILIGNLTEVKESLNQIQSYSNQLHDLVSLKVKDFSKKVGIGPLSPEEFSKVEFDKTKVDSRRMNVPLGINIDNLVFKPALDSLADIGSKAEYQAIELQHLLSTLSKKKSLLDSIPTSKPVNGWIASSYGRRTSPFTSENTMHRGVDIASGVGTPIYSPADGVVIFSGKKDGYGNFIMIAHGHGVVTRYGHNAQNLVTAGQKLKRGDQIGTVGMTGRTTGPHLHYEVWVNGVITNPKQFILDHY